MTFLAGHAGGHPSGCPHRAGLILSKKKKIRENFMKIKIIDPLIPKDMSRLVCLVKLVFFAREGVAF